MILRRFQIQQQEVLHFPSPKLIPMYTGCYKPCSYLKYSLIGEEQKLPYQNISDGFMLWSFANDWMVGKTNEMKYWLMFSFQKVETEQLIYPWQSLVAEFGGSLGLFLGFSLMTIWDFVTALKNLKPSKIFLVWNSFPSAPLAKKFLLAQKHDSSLRSHPW